MTRMWQRGGSGQWQCTGPAATSADRMELVHPPAPTLHTKHALPPPFPLPPLSFPDLASVAPPPDIHRIKHWIAAGSFLCQIPGPCGGGGEAKLRCVESRRAPICPPGSVNTGSRCGQGQRFDILGQKAVDAARIPPPAGTECARLSWSGDSCKTQPGLKPSIRPTFICVPMCAQFEHLECDALS